MRDHLLVARRRFARIVTVAALLSFLTGATFADEAQDRRTNTGVRLFRSLLSADVNLGKRTVDDNHLLILFFYVDDKRSASDLMTRFSGDVKGQDQLKGIPIEKEWTTDATFAAYKSRPPAAIFLAQAPDDKTLRSIIQYGIQNHLIVYSPFEGHVEKGVLGGLSIEAQVRPYVNLTTMKASDISLKEFFLKVTKVYQ